MDALSYYPPQSATAPRSGKVLTRPGRPPPGGARAPVRPAAPDPGLNLKGRAARARARGRTAGRALFSGPPGGGQGRVEEGPIRVMRIDNFGEYETKDGHHDGPMPRSLRGDEDARALDDACGDARPKHGEPRPEKSHRIGGPSFRAQPWAG